MPIIISGILLALFTGLLLLGKVGEVSYAILVAMSILLGIVLHGFNRLQELDLKNLRLVLRGIKETKEELFVREQKLKKIAIPLAQIIALFGASEGRISNRETWSIKRQWYRTKVDEMVGALDLPNKEADEIQKYSEKYSEIDQVLEKREALQASDPGYKGVKTKLEALSEEIAEMMKSDIGRNE